MVRRRTARSLQHALALCFGISHIHHAMLSTRVVIGSDAVVVNATTATMLDAAVHRVHVCVM